MATKRQLLFGVVLLVQAVVSQAADIEVTLSHLTTFYLPTFTENNTELFEFPSRAAEQLYYHSDTKLIYAVGGENMYILDAQDIHNITLTDYIKVPHLDLTDVEVCGEGVFIAYRNDSNKIQGGVRVYNSTYGTQTGSLTLLHDIPMGSLPDNIKSTPDCTLVAALENEGFVQGGQFYDPPGGVGIIRFPNGVTSEPEVKILNFTNFDDQFEQLSTSGVRWVYRTGTNNFSDNVEPEFVTFNHDHTLAYITLQENNAVAVVDLTTDTITAIRGLGFKLWGELDPSDRDGGINIQSWPVYGMYQPDNVQYVRWNDQDYLITANEGDAQEYDDPVSFSEEIRGKNIPDASIAATVTDSLKQALKNDSQLGRLIMSNVDGKNSEGKFERFYTYGARGFSVWRASNMELVFDSRSDMEKNYARLRPDIFNSNAFGGLRLNDTVDTRSDDKGSETETIATGLVSDHLLIFAGNERGSGIAVYSVAPGGMSPQFQTLYTGGIPAGAQDLRTWDQMYDDRELFGIDPEHIEFLWLSNGTTNVPVLLMYGSFSGTVSFLQVHVTKKSDTSLAVPMRSTGSLALVCAWLAAFAALH